MLRVVRERTQVPVPAVLDYCSDAEESGLGGEFVLMNFVDSDGDME
jgi:aminoglycoside phosphotransferase (APT) family kinase protein